MSMVEGSTTEVSRRGSQTRRIREVRRPSWEGQIFSPALGTRLYFTPDDRRRLVAYHRELAEKYQIPGPYFDLTPEQSDVASPTSDLLLEAESYLPSIDLKIGALAAFGADEVAAIIHDQVRTYVLEGTMGTFPIGDTRQEELLIASMIGNYSRDDLLISFQIRNLFDGSFKPVVGGKVVYGKQLNGRSRTIREVNGAPDATIPTFSAVRMDEELLLNSGLADITEEDVVGVSRFFRQSDAILEALAINAREARALTTQTVDLFVEAYVADCIRRNRPIPAFTIYDTHLPSLVRLTINRFQARIIADDGHVEPTPGILDSILRYHYGDPGYRGRISVVAVPTGPYLEEAKKSLLNYPSLFNERTVCQ